MKIAPILERVRALFGSQSPPAEVADWSLNACVHPLRIRDGHGGRVVDDAGKEYVDFLSAWGANVLGYGYPRVAEAIAAQAARTSGFGLPHGPGLELGELLGRAIPMAECVKYGKNGSDATLAAVRLARCATGRPHILYRGYHGFHDWYMSAQGVTGTPPGLAAHASLLAELTPEALEREMAAREGQVAGVILDMAIPPIPEAATLAAVVEAARRHGAVVIFDEIGTGFRLAPGGVQELTGVRPDLACYGKAMANGMPISALVGPPHLMQQIHRIGVGMTFEWECLSFAAALATIREIEDRNVCAELWRKGATLVEAYRLAAERHGVPTALIGPAPRPQVTFAESEGVSEREQRWLFLQEVVRRGVLTLGTFLVCYSHTDEDLRQAGRAFDCALAVVRRARERRSSRGLLDDRLYRGIRGAAA